MAGHRVLIVFWLALAFSVPIAQADQILLANGDRLTGKVVSKSDDILKFHTEYAGEINVQWKDVVSITTDAPVTILSPGGELQTGRLEKTPSGVLELISEGRSRELKLADIEHINPPPHVSGTGVTYSGHVDLAANASRGNTDDGRLYGEAEFKARAKTYRYRLFGRAEQKEESGATTAQNYFVSGERDNVIPESLRVASGAAIAFLYSGDGPTTGARGRYMFLVVDEKDCVLAHGWVDGATFDDLQTGE